MATDSRRLALRILEAGQRDKTTLDQALDHAGNELDLLSRQDRNLCNAIVFGVLRHRGHLDHLIRAFSRIGIDRLNNTVKTILRMGLFQLVFLDRVPDFAAIHSSIELAKSRVNKKSSGYINAVLRKAAEHHADIDLPDRQKQFPAYLKTTFSIPVWLGKRWTACYGRANTEAIARSVLEIPPLTLRVNTLKTDRTALATAFRAQGIAAGETSFSPLGLHLTGPGHSPAALPGFNQGHFQIQDEAAQLVVQALGPVSGERVLDACAGLGGKTCHMAQAMENSGEIMAADIGPEKLKRLEAEALRLGITIIRTKPLDILKAGIKDVDGYFDRVLVDAPCTGLGVMRRNPDTRWKRTGNDIKRMAARQKKILNAAANLVRPGGILVYAVCSCEPEENETVITHFLGKRKDYEADAGGFALTVPDLQGDAESCFQFKTYPGHVEMDGFFMARLKRKTAP
ncbi:MAG: 16S rRNA (cytosine(967)-C(5))-methyltransferase RsmB [Desulfobacter sp.]